MESPAVKPVLRKQKSSGERAEDGELRLLILEDNPYDAELMQENLRSAGISFKALHVESGAAFHEALLEFSPGLILSDYDLPGFNGSEALKMAREMCPEVPFILVTGAIGEEMTIQFLTSGATDYVLKNRMSRLVPAIRRALQEVREKRDRQKAELNFKRLVEQIPAVTYRLAIARGGAKKSYLYVSPQSESMMGIEPRDFLADPGILAKKIFAPDADILKKQMKAFRQEKNPLSAEYRLVHPDGRTVWVRDEAVLVRDGSGTPLYYQGILTDISRMKEAEEALRRAHDTLELRVRERTEELEAFTYSVSHDLHGPVWMLDNYIEMLLNDHGGKMVPDLADRIGVIRKTVKHMDRLIDDLLSLSRVNRTELSIVPLKLREIVLDAWREISSLNPGREIMFDVGELPSAAGDRNLVRQAVYNLLSNAVKFTGTRKKPAIEVGGYTEGKSSILYVRDNGVGFDMGQYDRLFGLFQRLHGTKFAGTGVGLTIVQRIVERHGGFIKAEGKVNGGATFLFSLPTRA
jgi:PAS domain S-box-containing protein